MRVVVIGAGVVGSSVAFRLAQAGAAVTVLEAGRIGGGTSHTSFAWINSASGGVPAAYHALRIASMAAHRDFWREFGEPGWFHPSGSLEWVAADKRAAQAENVARLQSRGYAVEWIDAVQALRMEPDLDPAAIGDSPVAWFPEEGWLDPVPFAGAMLRAARTLGTAVREHSRVAAIEATAGRVAGVRLMDGTRIAADRVVNCAGRWADAIAEDPAPRIPLAPTTGFLAFTPPVALDVSHVLHTPEMNLRPDGAGRLMLVWNDLADLVALDTTPDPRMPPVRAMMQGAARLFPGLVGMEAEAVRIGARPMPQDGLSAIGPMPRTEGYYLAVTHSGVTLSAIIGRMVAEEVALDRIRTELEPFRPARFFN